MPAKGADTVTDWDRYTCCATMRDHPGQAKEKKARQHFWYSSLSSQLLPSREGLKRLPNADLESGCWNILKHVETSWEHPRTWDFETDHLRSSWILQSESDGLCGHRSVATLRSLGSPTLQRKAEARGPWPVSTSESYGNKIEKQKTKGNKESYIRYIIRYYQICRMVQFWRDVVHCGIIWYLFSINIDIYIYIHIMLWLLW